MRWGLLERSFAAEPHQQETRELVASLGKATAVPAASLFLPSQGGAERLPNSFLPLTELRAKHEEQLSPQQGNTHTDGLHWSKECSHSTTDVGLDNKRTARTLLEFCGIFISFFLLFFVGFCFSLIQASVVPLLKLLILPHKLEQKFLRN